MAVILIMIETSFVCFNLWYFESLNKIQSVDHGIFYEQDKTQTDMSKKILTFSPLAAENNLKHNQKC